MGRVVVLGSANMDLVVRMPRRPEPGETLAFIGAVGSDSFGERLRARLVDDGVDDSRLQTLDAATGIAQISVTDDGENTIVIVPGANGHEGFDAADRAFVEGASHLVVQLERPATVITEAMRFARERGVTTVLTPAPARGGIDDLIDLSDVLVPNEGEAMLLSGAPDAESAAIALSRRAQTVVVTLGSRGALVAEAGEIVRRVAPRPVEAVDTTGAGDTFVGVMVAWLVAGHPLAEALDAATAGASIAVTRAGAASSMPMRDEIIAALD